jgi:hypothetical protein
VLYKEKDSDAPPRFWLVEGNSSRSAQLTGLGKYVLYEIQVLAFTRIGDGGPSHPPILERTLDDGEVTPPQGLGKAGSCASPCTTPCPALPLLGSPAAPKGTVASGCPWGSRLLRATCPLQGRLATDLIPREEMPAQGPLASDPASLGQEKRTCAPFLLVRLGAGSGLVQACARERPGFPFAQACGSCLPTSDAS